MNPKKPPKKATGRTAKNTPSKAKKTAAREANRTASGAAKKDTSRTGKASAGRSANKSSGKTTESGGEAGGFTAEERAAMKERARELKAESGRGRRAGGKLDGTGEVLAKIAEMPEPDRSMARRVHDLVTASAPDLSPKTWYGMPAYAKGGKVVFFFQSADRFKSRYATLGFSDEAKLDEGAMWPTSFALKKLTSVEEFRITELVKKAAG